MKRRDLIRHLLTHGCVLLGEGGRHSWWGHATGDRRSAVPRQTEIVDALARKICKDLAIPPPG